MSPVLFGFVAYLVAVLIAGVLTYRLNKSQEDFLLAGRRLNVWVATFSERASGESAWLLLGLPAVVMTVGLVEAWTAVGCVIGIAFAWFVIAEPLRRETERLGALTVPEFFSARFGEHAAAIRVTATLIVIFFYSFYVAAQFNGAGKILHQTLEIDQRWGIIIGAVVIILYTMMGGFFAVAWTDVVQAILMIGTLVVLPIVGMYVLSAKGTSIGAGLESVPSLGSWVRGESGLAAFAAVAAGLSWGFGYTGQPHTLARFMAIDSPEATRRGRIIAIAWAVPAFAGAVMIGLVGISLYNILDLRDPEQLMPMMALDLLPGWLAGVFVSGAIAAMMSTADSQLLVGTSAVAEDLLRRTFGIELSQKRLVLLSRAVTVGLGLAGYALAVTSNKVIFTLVGYAWAGLAASFGPALLLTLYWRRIRGRGVLWGMWFGAGGTILCSEIVQLRLIPNMQWAFAALFGVAGAFILNLRGWRRILAFLVFAAAGRFPTWGVLIKGTEMLSVRTMSFLLALAAVIVASLRAEDRA